MARFPDQSAFGASAPMDAENIDAPNQAAAQAPNTNALEIAKADSQYLVQTKALRDALAGEGEPDSLREKYEPLFRQAFDGGAALISDPQQRELWAQSRSPDFDGHLSATSDRAFNLTREREITGAAAQLDAMRDLAVQTADPAKRSEFIQAANGLIFGLQSAGYIEEAAAKEKQKAWAQDFALAAFSKRPAAEQVRWLEGDARERDAGKGELIDFVPADARESLLQTAQLNLRKETLAAQSAAALEQHNLKAQINDDLAAILKEGKGIDSLALEKVQTILGPDVTRNWRETRADFATIRSNTDDLYALTDTQLLERLYSLRPTGDMRDDPRKGAVFVEIFNQAERLLDLRHTDPAKSVANDPLVRAAQDAQAQPDDPQSTRDLYAARLAAQERAGIDRNAQSPITKDEALALIAPLRNVEAGQERDVLRRLGEGFDAQFGADAERAFAFALRALKSDTQEIVAAKQMLNAMQLRDEKSTSDPQSLDATVAPDSALAESLAAASDVQSGLPSTVVPHASRLPLTGDPLFGWDATGSQTRERDGLEITLAGLMAASGGGKGKNIEKAINFLRGLLVPPPPPERDKEPKEPPPDITPLLPSRTQRRTEPPEPLTTEGSPDKLDTERQNLPPLPEGATIVSEHPVLGPSIDGLKGRWKEALEWMQRAKTGDVRGALRHPDIPEPIDVVWGAPRSDYSEGFGLAKIAQLHPEVLPDLPERLAKMDVWQVGQNRIRLRGENSTAVISLNFMGEQKTWLLTAFDSVK